MSKKFKFPYTLPEPLQRAAQDIMGTEDVNSLPEKEREERLKKFFEVVLDFTQEAELKHNAK